MLRFSFGVSRTDRIRNEHISGTAQVGLKKSGKVWTCQRIYWTKDVVDGAAMQNERRDHRRGLMGVVIEDMKMVGVAGDRVRWRQIIHCCNHERVQMKVEEEGEEKRE